MSEFKSNNTTEFKAVGNLAHGYTVIPNGVMNDITNIGADGFMVLAKIFQYINSPTHVISIQGLSTQTGLNKDRVRKAIYTLNENGYIARTTKMNGNLKCGYVYEVFDSPIDESKRIFFRPIENPRTHRNTETQDTETQDTEYQYANKENSNHSSIKKENKDVVSEKEIQLIELYKAFKLEKRVMPHTINLLKKYSHISLDVFEQIFIDAAEDKVKSKYRYLVDVLGKIDSKGIKTLSDYNLDSIKVKSKEGKNSNVSKGSYNKFRNFEETYTKYSEEELEDIILKSQREKFEKN